MSEMIDGWTAQRIKDFWRRTWGPIPHYPKVEKYKAPDRGHRICNSEMPCTHTALEHGQMIQIERNKVLVGELVEALKDAIEFTEKATSIEGSEIVYRKIGNALTKAKGYLND